jgi:hypothetical protein
MKQGITHKEYSMEVFSAFFVQLDPRLQGLFTLGFTAVVSFLILQLAAISPVLAEYIGQYKVGIVTWLTGLAVQLVQAQLDKIPVTWETVATVAMQLIVEVALVLLSFALWRRVQFKGHRAL